MNIETTWTTATGIGVILLAFAAGGFTWWAVASAWNAMQLCWDEHERAEERRIKEEEGIPE